MAVGDVVKGLSSVNAGAYLEIQPGAGVEWIIHNIYHEAQCELHLYDGSNDLFFDADSGMGVWAWYEFHCTNSQRIRVKNTHANPKLIGYDGVQTK